MNFWRTYQKSVIYNTLNIVKNEKIDLLIWQKHKKSQVPAQITGLKENELIISLNLSPEQVNKLFSKNSTYYVHIKSLEILFKKDNFQIIANTFESTLPHEMQIYERRKSERFYYQYQDHKNLSFKNFKNETLSSASDYFQASVLVDISTSGAGIVINKNTKDKLKIGSLLYLTNLTDQKLPEPFEVKVMYIEDYKIHDDHELFKLGLSFTDELDSISYKSIKSIIEKKSEKQRGLSHDRFCGLSLEEQHKSFNHIESINPQLAINIKNAVDYLDRLRYLTTQMKIDLLKSTPIDLMASALRLSSKELIYELFKETTKNMQDDFLEKLEVIKPASAINKAQDQLCKIIREKERKGELVLSSNSFETYV